MKLPACFVFVGTAILIACSGNPGPQADSDTSNDSVEPNASRAPNGRCTTARQCTGLLPQLLFVCKDGQVAGDSWECKSDACVIVECAGHGGVAKGGVAGSHTASPSGGTDNDSGPTESEDAGSGSSDSGSGGADSGGGASEDAGGGSGEDGGSD
jgi:hypothetical protein